MPLSDIVIAALSRPAGRVVEAPVRELVAQALQDKGYASPAEVAALKDEISALRGQIQALLGRVAAVEAQSVTMQGEMGGLRALASGSEQRASAAEARATESEGRVHALEARAAALEAAINASRAERPRPAETTEPEPVAAPTEAGCKVPGCGERPFTHGFCRAHSLSWRAGRLAGFVSPEGLLDLQGRPARVAKDLAGLPYAVSERDGRLRIAGRFATAHPLAGSTP